MRKWLWVLLPLLAAAGYGLKLAADAGLFREVVERRPGTCRIIEGVFGPEDIIYDAASGWAYVSSQDRRAALNGAAVPGAIHRYRPGQPESLVNLTPEATIDFRPHGISIAQTADGKGRLFVVNHPGGNLFDRREDWPENRPRHTIEIFDLIDGQLNHAATHADALIRTPNDIAALDSQRYFFTNDHGATHGWKRTVEDYLRRPWSDIVYYDGSSYHVAGSGLNYANGIALSADRAQLYVAEVTRNRMREYAVDTNTGELSEMRRFDVGFGVDNISVDADDGALWLAGHVNLFAFLGHARNQDKRSPSVAVRLEPSDHASLETVFMDDGSLLSGASIAVRAGDYLLIGAVFERHLVECALRAAP